MCHPSIHPPPAAVSRAINPLMTSFALRQSPHSDFLSLLSSFSIILSAVCHRKIMQDCESKVIHLIDRSFSKQVRTFDGLEWSVDGQIMIYSGRFEKSESEQLLSEPNSYYEVIKESSITTPVLKKLRHLIKCQLKTEYNTVQISNSYFTHSGTVNTSNVETELHLL